MNAPSEHAAVLVHLGPLARRIRWKRWLSRLHRFTWLLALTFVAVFAVDAFFGMRTLGLRIASGITLSVALALFALDWIASWLVRLDLVGVAHLLEKKYPELAERLVTLVQIPEDASAFTPLLRAETERSLAAVVPAEACPLATEGKVWSRSALLFVAAFVGLCFVPGFGGFTGRFFAAWATPLVPLEIEVMHGNGYALRGGRYAVEAQVRVLDPNVAAPTACDLVCETGDLCGTTFTMRPTPSGRFAVVLEDLHQPLKLHVRAGEAISAPFEVRLIDAPAFSARPVMIVTPPGYLAKDGPKAVPLDESGGDTPEVLRYSKLRFDLSLDRTPVRAHVRVRKTVDDTTTVLASVESIAATVGDYQAEYVLELEHGLSIALPIGAWTVHDDKTPRFARSLRLHEGSPLSPEREIRIAPGDAVKLQTEIEDAEGLEVVSIEWRVNGERRPLEKWLAGGGKKTLAVNDWLPLPTGLKEGDRLSFRVHAFDNRRLRKGEVAQSAGVILPAEDLQPQVAIAPPVVGKEDDWFTLRVDRSVESLVKDQAKAQSDDLRDVILKIKAKVLAESAGVEQLRRTAHQAAAITQMQVNDTETLDKLNREIIEDLENAERRFSDIEALAPLAAHFLDIANVDMKPTADALARFRGRDRSVMAAEKDLEVAKDHLEQARKKLDRMLEWNKLLAQDRLDQFHLDKLAKQQEELAQRLQKLLNDPDAKNDAKQIEAIRQEQARLAEEMAKLQGQSKLIQDALAALEQARVDRLKQEAEQLALEQRTSRELAPEQMPAELKERIEKLAQLQDDLAKRVIPFAGKNQGPDVQPADAAANALKKPLLDEALEQQKEHEKRLEKWLGKLLPGVAVNSLREHVLLLLKKQTALRLDLERLGEELPQLSKQTLQERLNDLTKRQKELPAAIAALPIAADDMRLRPAQNQAQQTTQRAAERLAIKDALEAFFSMEQAEKDLQALASLLPATLPIDRADIKDPAQRERIDKVETFQREQAKLRAETEKLRSDLAKAAGAGPHPLTDKADKLASDLMELAQKASGPEAKAMAKESAGAVDQARKAMEASQAMKAKGDPDQAKKMDAEAASKLEFAVKQMAKLAQDAAMKNPPKDGAKAAASIKDGAEQMRKAEANLPGMPKDAQAAMKAAAKSLAQAAKDVSQQMASKMPNVSRTPPVKSMLPLAGGVPSSLPKELQAELLKGRNWGELPGNLKTQMIQDYATRFGPDHAEMIRQYFDRLSQTPPARKE